MQRCQMQTSLKKQTVLKKLDKGQTDYLKDGKSFVGGIATTSSQKGLNYKNINKILLRNLD